MRWSWISLLLCAACSSDPATKAPPQERTISKVDLTVNRISRLPEPVALAFLVQDEGSVQPRRLAKDFAAGNTWLHVRKPRGFSFAVDGLLMREEVFRPDKASLTFAQSTRTSSKPRKEPALLRLEGVIGATAMEPFLEVVPDPGVEIQGLGSIPNQDVRVLLGHGIDRLLEMTSRKAGGTLETDTHEWVAILDDQGKVVGLTDALKKARAARSLDPLLPYRVIVRRWRPSARPKATFFRLHMTHVLLAAQMAVKKSGDTFAWVWEGLWEGHMGAEPKTYEAPEWNDPPTLVLRYKEYERARTSGAFWRTLMSPLALSSKVGKAFFDAEPGTVDSAIKGE